MERVVNEVEQRLDRLPYGHVYEEKWILSDDDVRGVALLTLQTPNKSGAVIRESIQLVEPRHEPLHS